MYGIFLRKIFNKSDRDMPRNARRFTWQVPVTTTKL
jgi:hypothetical protein